MSNKGKSMECIQWVLVLVQSCETVNVCTCSRYQQTLHRNLVFLAGLADPNLNVQALIPVRVICSTPTQTTHLCGWLGVETYSVCVHSKRVLVSIHSMFSQSPGANPSAQHSTTQLPPKSGSPQPSFSTSAGSSPGSTPGGPVSSGASQPPMNMRQPQATVNPAATSTDSNWSANSQAARATPPSSSGRLI